MKQWKVIFQSAPIIIFLCLLSGGSCNRTVDAASDDAPAWLRQAASIPIQGYDKKVNAVVLVDDGTLKVEEDGRVTKGHRGAVRILTREGRAEARTRVIYQTDTEKVRDLKAWLIRPSGEVKKYGKEQIADISLADDDVYNESRVSVIIADNDAEPGAVFGVEWTTEDRSVFTQYPWYFQSDNPVVQSRFVVTLPVGWRAEAVTFNHPKIEPVVSGSTYTWELKDLPPVEEEPSGPRAGSLAASIAVSYFPAPNARSAAGRSFENWGDVSRWLTELSEPQAVLDDALATKAQSLSPRDAPELDRITAIGRYVQGVHYIAIQTGIGRGGGYRPHLSSEVFSKSYGDCKDKANLMKAMLKALKIPSYLVTIYSGDPTSVREEWPSPQQFNHCIIAVKVSDDTRAATIVNHPKLGRLLIFDPTDEDTPVGDLPDHEQGSLALIVAGDNGALMRMPVTPPESNRLERQSEVSLASTGAITGKIHEHTLGQAAVTARRELKHRPRADYVKIVERWITRGINGASVTKVEPTDNSDGTFDLNVEFSGAAYAQLMRDRLMIFKPAVVARRDALFLTEKTRKHAVILDSQAYSETVRIKLPPGFDVDELPDATKLTAAFGAYSAACEVKEGFLIFKREMTIKSATVPVDQYAAVRSFFEKIRAAEQAPVVLARK